MLQKYVLQLAFPIPTNTYLWGRYELVFNVKDWDEGTYIAEMVLPDGSREVRKVVK
jgi:hypothetical protein